MKNFYFTSNGDIKVHAVLRGAFKRTRREKVLGLMNRIVTNLWHCHDGWACSVNFATNDRKRDDDLDLSARRLWAARFKSSWYQSSRTREAAQAKLARKLEIAAIILPGVPIVPQPDNEDAQAILRAHRQPAQPDATSLPFVAP